jgi:NAD(P) transhydrogenase subunit beta
MTDMPQMVAIYNGMGGGAAAAIAAIEFAKGDAHSTSPPWPSRCADRRGLLHRLLRRLRQVAGRAEEAYRLPAQNVVNVVLALTAIGLGAAMIVLAPAKPELILSSSPSRCSSA